MFNSILKTPLAVFAAAAEGTGSAAAAAATETAPAATLTGGILRDAKQIETLTKAMRSRESFPTLAAAMAKLETVQKATGGDFFGVPFGAVGETRDESGAIIGIDESIYEGNSVVLGYVGGLTTLTGVAKGEETKGTGIKSIVLYPAPDVQAFSETPEGKAMLEKILLKEIGLVAYRPLRPAVTLAEFYAGIARMPKTVSDYATASEREGGVDTETFNAVWPAFRKALKESKPAVSKMLPSKAEMLRAIRSKAFAESKPEWAKLEELTVFTTIAQSLIDMAKNNANPDGTPNPLPTDSIESWLAGRDEFTFPASKAEEVDYSLLDSATDAASLLGF